MNPVIKSQTQAFQEEHSLSGFGESEAFEAYTIYSVIAGQLSYGVDPLAVHLKGDEFGLDGVAILIQGKLATDTDEAAALLEDVNDPDVEFIFFQSKTGTSYDYGDLGKVFDGIEQFFDDGLLGESDQLDDLIYVKNSVYDKAVTRRNPALRIYYATTGNYKSPSRIEALIQKRTQALKDQNIFDNERVSVEMLGAEKLQTFYRSAKRSSKAKIEFSRQVALPKNEKVDQGYIGFINATEIVRMVQVTDDEGEVVGINKFAFFDNVRDFNSKSPLNDSISLTLKNGEGHDFVFRNNGVTVIAKYIHRTADEFTIEDFQIVNGCQTTNILYNNRENLENVTVPFRLIGASDDNLVSSIIIGTNSQNQIKPEQFLALLPFVKNLEEYSRSVDESFRVYIERRENQYQHENIERARIMPMAVLMKTVCATLLRQPNRSARDYKKLFKENKSKLFNQNSDVQIYHAVAYLYYKLEFLWRNQRIDSSLKLFRFYIIWASVRQATDGEDISSISRPNACATIAKKITSFASNDGAFKLNIEAYGKALNKEIAQLSLENREKLRDSIRSDQFFKAVSARIFPHP